MATVSSLYIPAVGYSLYTIGFGEWNLYLYYVKQPQFIYLANCCFLSFMLLSQTTEIVRTSALPQTRNLWVNKWGLMIIVRAGVLTEGTDVRT